MSARGRSFGEMKESKLRCSDGGCCILGVVWELCVGCDGACGGGAGLSWLLKAFSKPKVCADSFGGGNLCAGGIDGP